MHEAHEDYTRNWRRTMIEGQLHLVALFIKMGEASFYEARFRDWNFARNRALRMLEDIEEDVMWLEEEVRQKIGERYQGLRLEAYALASLNDPPQQHA